MAQIAGAGHTSHPLWVFLLSVPLPFADAPNPADCPHHQCPYYHQLSPGGIATLAVVAIVVAVLIGVLAIALVLRHRRNRRSTEG